MDDFCKKCTQFWQQKQGADAYPHRFEAYIRPKYEKRGRKKEEYKRNRFSSFHGSFMHQNCYEAKI
jgi:hypothetical protein